MLIYEIYIKKFVSINTLTAEQIFIKEKRTRMCFQMYLWIIVLYNVRFKILCIYWSVYKFLGTVYLLPVVCKTDS